MAEAQAAAQGMNLDEYVAPVLVVHRGAQAEVERFFAARAVRAAPARAREVLARMGLDNPPLPGDERFDREPSPPT